MYFDLNIHYYHRTFASFCNFYNKSSTSFTITPPFFFAGSPTSNTFTLLCPRFNEFMSTSSIGAFFAFIIIAKGAIFGVLSLKSQVIIAGLFIERVYNPVSTYLVTSTSSFFISTFEANVACGQPSIPASICPVWLQSSSTAKLSNFYIVFPG